jgi:FixJ family two-component response regulator
MMITPAHVSVVDDDESVRESLPDLLRQFGFDSSTFSSAEDFLTSDRIFHTRCLILDVGMPGISGPDLFRELKRRGLDLPVIFITAHKDETLRLQLLKQGAIECLFKPFRSTALLNSVKIALKMEWPAGQYLAEEPEEVLAEMLRFFMEENEHELQTDRRFA